MRAAGGAGVPGYESAWLPPLSVGRLPSTHEVDTCSSRLAGPAARAPRRRAVAAHVRRPRHSAVRHHLRRRRPRDHRRLPRQPAPSPRSAPSRCAAARCSASSTPWSTPGCRSPPSSPCSPASPTPRSPRRPGSTPCCRPSSSSRAGATLVAHNAPFDMGFLKAAAEQHDIDWPRLRRPRHRPAGPAHPRPRRGPQLQAQHPRPALPRHHHAHPPRTRRRPRHRRRAARPLRAGRLLRGHHASTSSARSPRRVAPGPAAQAAPRRRRPARPRRLPLPRRPATGALHRQVGRPAVPRPAVLHRGRGRGGGWPRWSRPPKRSWRCRARTLLEAEVRELRMIAEYKPPYNRRSRFPEKVSFLKLTAGPFPRLSIVREVKDDGAHLPRPVQLAPPGGAGSRRPARDLRPASVHAAAVLPHAPGRPASWPRCSAAAPRAKDARASTSTPQVVEAAAAAMDADARPVVEPLSRRMTPLVAAASASRTPSPTATGCGRCSRRRPAPSGCARSGSVPRARGGPTDARGRLGDRRDPARPAGRRRAAPPAASPRSRSSPRCAPALTPSPPSPGGFPSASAEEAECLLRWLDSPGVRLVHLEGVWASPRHGSRGLESAVSLTAPSERGDRP